MYNVARGKREYVADGVQWTGIEGEDRAQKARKTFVSGGGGRAGPPLCADDCARIRAGVSYRSSARQAATTTLPLVQSRGRHIATSFTRRQNCDRAHTPLPRPRRRRTQRSTYGITAVPQHEMNWTRRKQGGTGKKQKAKRVANSRRNNIIAYTPVVLLLTTVGPHVQYTPSENRVHSV